ncbi:MAG: hypothetical protein HZA19_06920 [Nitrospirae bacterium]|nr:hypothetical protein [Nitrospirota bacterium]
MTRCPYCKHPVEETIFHPGDLRGPVIRRLVCALCGEIPVESRPVAVPLTLADRMAALHAAVINVGEGST